MNRLLLKQLPNSWGRPGAGATPASQPAATAPAALVAPAHGLRQRQMLSTTNPAWYQIQTEAGTEVGPNLVPDSEWPQVRKRDYLTQARGRLREPLHKL